LRTPRIVVHTDFTRAEAQRYLDIFEAFWDYFEREWFAIPQTEPLDMLLFQSEKRFERWNAKHGQSSAMGRYFIGDNLITVNAGTGLGTSLHELVHHFVSTSFERLPNGFVNEGIASFFEKFIGYLDADGKLHLTMGYFSPWRFVATKLQHAKADIQKLWTRSYDELGPSDWNYARAFMLFLHRRKQLVPFVRALLHATGDGRNELETACGQTLSELDTDWHAWVEAQDLDPDVLLVSRAFVHDLGQWKTWRETEGADLELDEKLGIYRHKR